MKPMLTPILAAAMLASVASGQAAPAATPAAATAPPPETTVAEPGETALDVRPATAAAQAWVAQLDAHRFGEAWDDAAPLLQGAIEREKWEATIQKARGPLGAAVSRKLRSATYATRLPNAPAGEYVVIEYDTRFANRPLTVETVTPMRQPDGRWRVAGYFIR